MDYTILSIYVVLGIPLLISYWILATKDKNVIDNFWTNNGKVKWLKRESFARKLYMLSFIISALAGIYLLYYFTWGNNQNGFQEKKIFGIGYEEGGKYIIYVSFLLILVFSLMWIPSFKLAKNMTTPVLFMVAIGSLLLLVSISASDIVTVEDQIALAASVYFVFHITILDGLLWTDSIKI